MKNYEIPEFELISTESTDVIATSGDMTPYGNSSTDLDEYYKKFGL